jgi:PAS domain S-box-containing protein
MASSSEFGYNIGEVLTENLDDLIFVLNENFECEFVNEKIHIEKLGYLSLKNKITVIFHQDDLQLGNLFLQRLLKNGQAIEHLRIRQKNSYVYYEFKGKTFTNEKQEIKLLISSHDISQFKRAEREWLKKEESLKRSADDLQEIRFWKLLQTTDEKTSFQKSREMLDLVIDNIPQIIYWKNKDLVYLGCNQNYALINNFDAPNYILGKIDKDLPWAKINLNTIQDREKNVMNNNQSEISIETLNLPGGKTAFFEVNRVPLNNLEGGIVGILCTYNNISDRVKAEQTSKMVQRKYTDLVESIREAYFEVELNGTFVFMNKSFTQMTGYSFDELVGKNYQLLMDDENKNKVFKIFNTVYISGLPQDSFQFEFIKKGDKRVIVETSVYLSRNPSGRKLGFYGITRDITKRFKLEQKLKQSEEKYRHLFENSPFGIWIVDLNGEVIDCNAPKNIMLSKYTRDDIIGKNFIEVLGIFDRPEYFIPFFKSKFENFVKGTPMKALEFKMTRADGIEKWINVRGSKIKIGEDTFIQVLMQDITEKKIADLKLQKSEEELKVLNKELERKVLERTKELRESEEKFRTIAENSLMGVAIIQDNKVKYVNQQFAILSGYDVDEVKEFGPMDIFQSIHPDDRKLVMEQLRKKQKGLKDYISHYQYRIIDKEGGIKWIDNYSKTINFMGRPADLVSGIDITDRKKAEQELKESEEKYRLLFENMNSGFGYSEVIVNDDNKPIDYRFIEVNSQFEKLTGLKVSDIIGKTVTEVLPGIENDPADWIGRYGKVGLTGEPLTAEDYSEPLERWYNVSGYSPKKGFFAVTFSDITDRKRAEKKLKESEEKYRHLYENSPFSIVLLDTAGKIIDMNTKTTELFGYEKKDLIDKNYLNLTGIYPSDTKPSLRLIQELMSKGEPSSPIMKPQLIKIFNKEMKAMWVESELSTIKIGGELVIQAIIQDITEKKLAEEKLKESERILRQQNIELKELDRLKTDFISIAAHDLKTPLISVGGYIDLILLREKELNEEVKEDLNRVLNNVRRLEGYINRLLDVMKIEAKKVELVKREENIHDIIINCLSDLEFQIGQKDLTINFDISENLKLRVDHFRISQAILNLLTNAVKYTPKNGKIDISIVEEGESVLFKIKDNGKGLTSEEIQKIFGKFVTIEQGVDGYSSLDKGSGLGLYIAQGFIEAHGGKIWVESKGRDLGAEFSFTLPKQ